MAKDIVHGTGYRVSLSDRELGDPTSAEDGFVVFNQRTGKLFIADSGIWTDGGDYPGADFTEDDFDDWVAS
jgi:hypothetical protein